MQKGGVASAGIGKSKKKDPKVVNIILALHDYGCSYSSIAEVTGCSEGFVGNVCRKISYPFFVKNETLLPDYFPIILEKVKSIMQGRYQQLAGVNRNFSAREIKEVCDLLQFGFSCLEIRNFGYNYQLAYRIKNRTSHVGISSKYEF